MKESILRQKQIMADEEGPQAPASQGADAPLAP